MSCTLPGKEISLKIKVKNGTLLFRRFLGGNAQRITLTSETSMEPTLK